VNNAFIAHQLFSNNSVNYDAAEYRHLYFIKIDLSGKPFMFLSFADVYLPITGTDSEVDGSLSLTIIW